MLGKKKSGAEASTGDVKTIEIVKLADKNTPESIQNVDIAPGTKVIDLKERLGFRASDDLARAKDDSILENKTDLYKLLDDGEKIVILPETIVGTENNVG